MLTQWLMFKDPKLFLVYLIVIILSISLHEFGHALSADLLGDDTPSRQGRLTVWPPAHFDPVGLVMIFLTLNLGFGLGWGRPVQVDSYQFKNPRRDMLIVAICGPVMNLLIAIVSGLILRTIISSGHLQMLVHASTGNHTTLAMFLMAFLSINVMLMLFNLIPIHPLDGSKVLSALLPRQQSQRYDQVMGMYGPLILLGVVFLAPGVLNYIVGPASSAVMNMIMGT